MLRRATPADIAALNKIINYYIANTTYTYYRQPQTLEETQRWFCTVNNRRYDLFVIEEDGDVVGYGCYSAFRKQISYEVTVEHSIYLLPGYEGKGYGRKLMEALICGARAKGYWTMVAVIDGSNRNSVAFHEHMGFTYVGELRDVARKFDRTLGVVFLQYPLNTPHMDPLTYEGKGE